MDEAGPLNPRSTADYPALPTPPLEEVEAFTAALARRLGRDPSRSARALTRMTTVNQRHAGQVMHGSVALPPVAMITLLDNLAAAGQENAAQHEAEQQDAEAATLIRLYLEAYGGCYHDARNVDAVRRLRDRLSSSVPMPDASSRPPRDDPALRLLRESRHAAKEAGRLLDRDTDTDELTDLYVPRAAEAQVRALSEKPGTVVVVGEPGVGKTSLLWHLSRLLEAEGRPWFFVRAVDLLPREPWSARAPLGELEVVVRAPEYTAATPVVLLDTADLLLHDDDGSVLLHDALERAATWSAALVVTCRQQEFGRMKDLPHEKVTLGPYTPGELAEAVKRHALHYLPRGRVDVGLLLERIERAVTRGLPLTGIVERPLTLRMLFETHREIWSALAEAEAEEPDAESRDDGPDGLAVDGTATALEELDVSDLYHRYWELRVRRDRRVGVSAENGEDASDLAHLVAILMLAVGEPVVRRDRGLAQEMARSPVGSDRLEASLEALLARHVVLRRSGRRTGDSSYPEFLEFFHQTFFEYAAARALGLQAPDVLPMLTRRIADHPEDLFLAAVVQQLLVDSCRSPMGAERVDGFFAGLLSSGREAKQQLAVSAYALARYRGTRTAGAARTLLTVEPGLVKRYLDLLPKVRHDDVVSVLDDLAVVWSYVVSNDRRAGILRALAVCAAQQPFAVHTYLLQGDIDWQAWFDGLEVRDAQRLRQAPLALVEVLAEVDDAWAANVLEQVARAVVRGSASRDSLAVVLAAAAGVLNRPAHLQRMIDLVPLDRAKPSGLDELRAAIAGLFRRLWAPAAGRPTLAHVVDLVVSFSAGGVNADEPRFTVRQAAWVAIGELALQLPDDEAGRLVEMLLELPWQRDQTDVAEHALPRLLEGRHRLPLPGQPAVAVADPAAAIIARAACGRRLRQLPAGPKDPERRRTVSTVCRSAIETSRLPEPDVRVLIEQAFRRSVPPTLWLDPAGLAALTVQAALGGNPDALGAVQSWTRGSAGRDVDTILGHRLALAAERGNASALEHLVVSARRTLDVDFLRRAIKCWADRRWQLPDVVVAQCWALGETLVSTADEQRRGAGYDLLALFVTVPPDPQRLVAVVARGLSERQAQPVTKALTLMERLLAGRADDVGGPEAFGRLETLLTAWSDSDRGTPRIRARAAACLRDLYCRAGSLRPEDVGSTLAAARRLALEAGDEAAPRAFAHLLGRLARVDAEGAAEQLVEASRAIHEWPGDQRSWKLRWARAARPALVGVIAALTTTRWRQMLRGLVPHDPGLLAQAVEVAAEQRDEPQSFIEAELAQEHCAHARALLTLAWQRRLRRDGSRLRWPEILERWHARGSAAERGRAPS